MILNDIQLGPFPNQREKFDYHLVTSKGLVKTVPIDLNKIPVSPQSFQLEQAAQGLPGK